MPAYDTAVAGQSNGTNSIILTLTTAGANEALLVYVHFSNTSSVSGITGTGLTFVKDGLTLALGANGKMERWRCLAAAQQTSASITISTTGSPQMTAVLIAVSNVYTTGSNGAGFIGTVNDAQASSAAPTSTLTTSANGSLVIAGFGITAAATFTAGSGQTNRATSSIASGFSTIAGLTQNAVTSSRNTSVTMNATASTSNTWGVMATEILGPSALGDTLYNHVVVGDGMSRSEVAN